MTSYSYAFYIVLNMLQIKKKFQKLENRINVYSIC